MDVKMFLVVILFRGIATDNVLAGLNDVCTDTSECSDVNHAVCSGDGKCSCDTGYAPNAGDCDPALNQPCTTLGSCASENAECIDTNSDDTIDTCKCVSGFKDNDAGDACVPKAVSDNECTNDGTECNGIANAECDKTVGVLKCKCKDGFTENSNVCQADVTGAVCGSPTVSEVACSTIDNAECVGTAPGKCVCKTGTTHDSGSCTLGLEGDCTGDLTCTTMNAECSMKKCSCKSGYVANNGACDQVLTDIGCTAGGNECLSPAVCGSNNKCQCSDGYVLESNNCVKVLTDIGCSANGDDDCTAENSVCGNNDKCQCDVGFLLQGNKCETDSGAASTKAIIWPVFASLLILLVNKLMM